MIDILMLTVVIGILFCGVTQVPTQRCSVLCFLASTLLGLLEGVVSHDSWIPGVRVVFQGKIERFRLDRY